MASGPTWGFHLARSCSDSDLMFPQVSGGRLLHIDPEIALIAVSDPGQVLSFMLRVWGCWLHSKPERLLSSGGCQAPRD